MSKKWIRGGLTLAILAAITSQVDLVVIGKLMERVDPTWLVAAFLVLFVVRVLVAWRFQVLLGAQGIDSGLAGMVRVVLVSNALGHLLPAGIGQDVIRGHQVVRTHGRAVDVSASIIHERLAGIASMLAVAFVAGATWLTGSLRFWTIGGVALVGVALVFGCSWARSWSGRGGLLPAGLPLSERVRVALSDVASAVADTERVRPVLIPVLGISVAVQLSRCVVFWCLYAALGDPVSLVHALAFVPLVFLATSIPVSVGGLGVREAALIALVGQLGVSVEVNVAVGLAFQCLTLSVLLPGLVLYGLRGIASPSVPVAGHDAQIPVARTSADS
jgi:hypothetical protein